MRSSIAFLLLLFLPTPFFAQGKGDTSEQGMDMTIQVGTAIGGDEFLLGAGGGIASSDERFHGGVSLFMRPHYVPRIHREDGQKVQYRERRYAALLQFEYRLHKELSWKAIPFLGMSTGPSIEERRSFKGDQGFQWMLVPRTGFSYSFSSFLRVEMEYRFSPEASLNGSEHLFGLRTIIGL